MGLVFAPQSPPSLEAGMDKNHKILLDALGFDLKDFDSKGVARRVEAGNRVLDGVILELKSHVQAARRGRFSRVRSRGER